MRLAAALMNRSGRSGQALVEQSIALLGVLVFLLGTIETGRLLLTYTTLAHAVRAGVRYAAVHGNNRLDCTGCLAGDGPSGPGDTGSVTAVVQDAANAAGLSTAALTVTVTYPGGTSATNQAVIVTANYTYTPTVSLISFGATPIILSSTSEGTVCY